MEREDSELVLAELQVELPNDSPPRLWTGAGCQACSNTGYSGRAGIYEIIQVTDQLHAPIVNGPDIAAIRAMIHKQGMPTMFQDGLGKALNGDHHLGRSIEGHWWVISMVSRH